MQEALLLIPGPTNLSMRVREVLADPQMSHVGSEFVSKFKNLIELTRYAFRNEKGSQIVFTGSGTAAMESAVVSTLSHGDKSLVLNTGYFGKRFLILNQLHKVKTNQIEYQPGHHADPDDLRKELKKSEYKAVFITHVDTSTSVQNPVEDLVTECNNAGAFSIVDSVCGLGGSELDFDRLQADIVFTASQKALAGPPGAVIVAVSKELMDYMEKREDPIESYYLSLPGWRQLMERPEVYRATPAVQLLLALREALIMVKEEGIEKRWERHRELGRIVRSTVSELGLNLIADEGYRADTVTSFRVKDGTAEGIQKTLENRHNVIVARGLQEEKDRQIRLGHFGILMPDVLTGAMRSLREVIVEQGVQKVTPR
jgi:alanine-glyoxylate transaminase/serine-glyoxylate transaminase/serine-pyruvate transaminase